MLLVLKGHPNPVGVSPGGNAPSTSDGFEKISGSSVVTRASDSKSPSLKKPSPKRQRAESWSPRSYIPQKGQRRERGSAVNGSCTCPILSFFVTLQEKYVAVWARAHRLGS